MDTGNQWILGDDDISFKRIPPRLAYKKAIISISNAVKPTSRDENMF
jgi:hypothetical protein